MAQRIRTILESDFFTASRVAIEGSATRLDEILEGSILSLATRPTDCPRVPGTILYRLRTEEFLPEPLQGRKTRWSSQTRTSSFDRAPFCYCAGLINVV